MTTPSTSSGTTPSRRTRARQFALQALYQWLLTGYDVGTVEQQFLEDGELARADVELFVTLLRGIPARVTRLDAELGPLLSRPLDRLDPVARAVLYIGAFELQESLEIPAPIIINEAVELAKTFGAEQSHRFINGVLDQLARRLRPHEGGSRPGPPRRPPRRG
jgi:N utilization substance protein B